MKKMKTHSLNTLKFPITENTNIPSSLIFFPKSLGATFDTVGFWETDCNEKLAPNIIATLRHFSSFSIFQNCTNLLLQWHVSIVVKFVQFWLAKSGKKFCQLAVAVIIINCKRQALSIMHSHCLASPHKEKTEQWAVLKALWPSSNGFNTIYSVMISDESPLEKPWAWSQVFDTAHLHWKSMEVSHWYLARALKPIG